MCWGNDTPLPHFGKLYQVLRKYQKRWIYFFSFCEIFNFQFNIFCFTLIDIIHTMNEKIWGTKKHLFFCVFLLKYKKHIYWFTGKSLIRVFSHNVYFTLDLQSLLWFGLETALDHLIFCLKSFHFLKPHINCQPLYWYQLRNA